MILVDSCGWLEAIKGAGLAASYAPALAQPDEVLVPTVCVLEVARVMCRERGEQAAAERVEDAIRAVIAEGLTVTYDLGGSAGTSEFADAIVARLESVAATA